MSRRNAFTLIELLVVIAIIGILSAIIFPVFARMKDSAYKSGDLTNMNSIRTALQLYRADQGAYPPTLLGYASGYSNFVPSAADIIPANLVVGALYPKRIASLQDLRPAYIRPSSTALEREFTRAVWPNRLAADANFTDLNAVQRFGPADGFVQRCFGTPTPTLTDNWYYRLSGYDVAEIKTPTGSRTELRYAPFWTRNTVPTQCAPIDAAGSGTDDPRQLGYSEPPETTVITWNSFFREYNPDNSTQRIKRDIVLFLGGGARPYDSAEMFNKSFKALP